MIDFHVLVVNTIIFFFSLFNSKTDLASATAASNTNWSWRQYKTKSYGKEYKEKETDISSSKSKFINQLSQGCHDYRIKDGIFYFAHLIMS